MFSEVAIIVTLRFAHFANVFQTQVLLLNNIMRKSRYGVMFRVCTGATLSTIDAATDISVIATYYNNPKLVGKAHALLAMLAANVIIQSIYVLTQFSKKDMATKIKEWVITLLFLRPAVDAYRVSTNHQDGDEAVDSLSAMMMNKGVEVSEE